MKKWIALSVAISGVLVWVGFLEFHEAYIDVLLRERITIYSIHLFGLFYGIREILTREDWEPYRGLDDIFPDNEKLLATSKKFLKRINKW
jgi:hypothetical protein